MTGIADQLREEAVNTALGRIRLQVGGSGSPILFWPSLLMTGDMWYGVAADLIDRHQVVLIDPPGQGSSQPLTRLSPSPSAHAVLATSSTVSVSNRLTSWAIRGAA